MIRTIPLKIQNEYITGDKGMIGAAGSHNDVILRMEFSGMWDGLTKMVQFRDALGEATIEVLLTADMLEADDTSVYLVPVPNGAKKYAGEMTLCIKGAAVSEQKETRATLAVYGRFTVAESKWSVESETEADVPASNVEQLQGQIDNVLATILDARKAATEAAKSAEGAALSQFRAQTYEQYAGEYAQDAADSATAAENSAASASSRATSAANSAASASSSATAAANSATAAKASEDAAAGSAANAAASATSAGNSADNAANSASVASSNSNKAKKAAFDAQAAKNNAADSQTAAKQSEDNAAASATSASDSAASAAESIKHAPRINADGKWELWDATTNAYVTTEYTAIGEDGTKWWTYEGLVTNILGKLLISKKYLPSAVIGDYVFVTLDDAGVVYTITGETESGDSWVVKMECILKGTDGTTPHIGENGNWYIGSTDTGNPSRGATGEKGDPGEPGAAGKDGVRGRGWYQHSVKASNPQVVAWTGWPAAPKWGEGDWLYNPDNGNVGICTSRTDNADGSGSASITYKGTLKGTDGITPHIGTNGNWFLGDTDTGVEAKGQDGAKWFVQNSEPQTGVNTDDYWLNTGTGDVYRAVVDPDSPVTPVNWKFTGANLTGQQGQKGTDGITPHIGTNGNWFLGDTDTGVEAKGQDGAKWFVQNSEPQTGVNTDDYWLNTGTGDVYRAVVDPDSPVTPVNWKFTGANLTGQQGQKGTDGITPHIGTNGNWYLGTTDTGKPSRGATGAKGDPGTDYVLTSADKAEIAALVLAEIPNGDEVTYG